MNETLDQKIRHRNAVARAHSQVISGQTTKLMVKESPAYSGRAREVLPIVLVNVILTFLTVGIYRFWAKTRLRRYFMSRISFFGDPLEYSGTGLELFVGFLIVLAILVPMSIGVGLLQGFVAPPGTDPQAAALFQLAYLLVFYFLYNVAVYRAQRYRLSRISWRGIRGGQEGSALLYAVYAMGMGLLTVVTYGLLYPIMRRILVGYRINRASFGTQRLEISGGMLKLFGAWMAPWLTAAAFIATVLFALGSELQPMLQSGQNPKEIAGKVPAALADYKAVLLPLAILFPVAFVWYRSIELRQWFGRTRFDQLGFGTRIHIGHLLLPYLAYLAVLALVVGCLVYGVARLPDFNWGATGPNMSLYLFGIVFAVGAVTLWLLGGVLHPVIVQNWLLRNVCKTLTIQGTFSPDTLFQNQQSIPRSGEGLADAFDVDAF